MALKLSIYDIIQGPRLSSKAYQLNQSLRQLVLNVHTHANKPQIAEALKKLFNVEAESIRVVVCKGKQRRSGRFYTIGKTRKKAIVTLKEGQSLDVMGWNQPMTTDAETAATE